VHYLITVNGEFMGGMWVYSKRVHYRYCSNVGYCSSGFLAENNAPYIKVSKKF